MSRFNTPATGTKTKNIAGGPAYKQDEKLELVSILFTSFVQDQFYRSADQTLDRVKELIQKAHDKKFVAKAALYARTKFGMRSITHVVAGELFRLDGNKTAIAGEDWVKRYLFKAIHRPDDATEIMSYYLKNVKKKAIPGQLKKGIAAAIEKFDEYQLSKYRSEKSSVKMIDLVNLCHPQHNPAIEKLVKGELVSTETWEAKLTAAGQNAKGETKEEIEESKENLKREAWEDLIENKKIGQMALLRNLRNILEQAPNMVLKACELLTDQKRISSSLILPFRYTTAIESLKDVQFDGLRNVIVALNKALELSVNNVPNFDGKTLVAIDVSGSMNGKPREIASLFAGILAKRIDQVDLRMFSDGASFLNYNPTDSMLTLSKQIFNAFQGGGTDFDSIFEGLDRKYDRIIILSDMQGWMQINTPVGAFNKYVKRTNTNPYIYSWDLAGLGTMQFPKDKVFCLAGFSEKVFDLMKMLEEDKNAMIRAVESVEI